MTFSTIAALAISFTRYGSNPLCKPFSRTLKFYEENCGGFHYEANAQGRLIEA